MRAPPTVVALLVAYTVGLIAALGRQPSAGVLAALLAGAALWALLWLTRSRQAPPAGLAPTGPDVSLAAVEGPGGHPPAEPVAAGDVAAGPSRPAPAGGAWWVRVSHSSAHSAAAATSTARTPADGCRPRAATSPAV